MDRVSGAIMGALIGDALGLGCHWYYDLAELRKDYGPWIDGYTTPRPDRYHGGMNAGQLSQTGLIFVMLLRSVAEHGEYREEDFTRRLDEELFPLLNGTPEYGPGGYTSQSIREAYRRRVEQGKTWGEAGGHADTTEAAERAIVLAAHYANQPRKVAETVSANCLLTQGDEAIVAMTTAYNVILSRLIAGEKLTPVVSDTLMQLVQSGELPFHSVTKSNLAPPRPGDPDPPRAGRFSSPDALLTPHYVALAAIDPDIRIEPAWKVSIVYGMPCAIYHQLPAAYYLAARFADDFESAVLHAVNGGGQNMSRAMLTGALVGAQVGLEGIPQRFLDGLENGEELLALARKIGTQS
ncbi:ADP-ribosylglycohydrolase family protein [Nitrosospira sp. NpAV]|uniref:ADP-ribosylglycohydrolase family protein n=1 Tax=Nitrosospira sp. NpAV TaxID=58133 RepID=UPI00059FEF84|nr:ADP-ribosylglycohydrolase family protein [Nitrosospira sp. NpAV]KIO47895.1 ADP-ribosylglycohydrolase [Nitrosospira sp. NpAV]